jgi:hypothetical protein
MFRTVEERDAYAKVVHEDYMRTIKEEQRIRLQKVYDMTTEEYLRKIDHMYPDGFYGLCN